MTAACGLPAQRCWVPLLLAVAAAMAGRFAVAGTPHQWLYEWPNTDFSVHSVAFDEIKSGGPPKDGIPAIDEPVFVAVAAVDDVPDREPVIGLSLAGESRAYPLRVLMWHEIVNDTVGGIPVAVTYCPLCNSAIVFDRRVAGRVLDFGTTGKLRHSDLVMYDRQTESWWQQFQGQAIVGSMTGERLKMLPARIESLALFRERAPDGEVLVPADPSQRSYGTNPYAEYDSVSFPFLYRGDFPAGIAPLERVVSVEGLAWSLNLLRARGTITAGDFVIDWQPGQASALDTPVIAQGYDIGNVTAQRTTADGKLEDVLYRIDFAFAFHVFSPDIPIQTE